MLYRLFTENKNYDQIEKLVSESFDGFTLIKTDGIWQGESEHSLIIEIDKPNGYISESGIILQTVQDAGGVVALIEQLCYAIKKLNQQDKILVQRIESDSKLV